MRRIYKTPEDTMPKLRPKGHNSGPAGPVGRPLTLVQSPILLPFDVDSPTTFEDASTPLLKSV